MQGYGTLKRGPRQTFMGALGADFYNLTFFSSRPRYIFPDDLAQPVGQFLVNFSPVTDGENPDDTCFAIQLINDTESSDFEFPQP